MRIETRTWIEELADQREEYNDYKTIFKLELARRKSKRKSTSKTKESDPTHESHHNIKDVEIEAVGEV